MGKRRPGRPVTHPPVICEETGRIFKTYTEAAESINGWRSSVYRCAIGIQRQHNGYHFSFVDNKEDVNYEK